MTTSRLRTAFFVFLMIYGLNFFFLFSSEILSAVFSLKQALAGQDLPTRILSAFKPLVVILYVVFSGFLCLMILRLLGPLFRFVEKGTDEQKARQVMVRIPIWLIVIQNLIWALGTVVYFVIKQGQMDSGHSFFWILSMKLAAGLESGVFSALVIHTIVKEYKQKLNMISIEAGERDWFMIYKEYFAFAVFAFNLVINLSFMALTYQNWRGQESLLGLSFDALFLASAAFLGGLGLLLISILRKPYLFQIAQLKNRLATFSGGKSDLSQRIVLHNFDEIGELAYRFNLVLGILSHDYEVMRGSTRGMETHAQAVSRSAEALSSAVESQSLAGQRISEQIENLRKLIDQVNINVENQKAVMEKHDLAAGDLDQGNDQILSLNQSLKELASHHLETARRDLEIARVTVTQSLSINQQLRTVIEMVADSRKKTEAVDAVLAQIEEIAERTNVLAINAAVEAAHSGAYGRGFAVIAEQVRRVAQSTAESVRGTSELIQSMKESIAKAYEHSQNVAGLLDLTQESGKGAESALRQIMDSMETNARKTLEISTVTDQQAEVVQTLKNQTGELKDLTLRIQGSLEPQVDGAKVLAAALAELNVAGAVTARQARDLSEVSENLVQESLKLSKLS